MSLYFYICRVVKLPAIEKAVCKNRPSTAAVVKSDPLDDSSVIIDDEPDVKPLIVGGASKIISDSKQPCLEMKPLQLRPVPKQVKQQTERRGRSFKYHELSRQDVKGTTMQKPDYNELKAAEDLVGLGDEQTKTGYICNLRKHDEKSNETENENKEQPVVAETETENKDKEQPVVTETEKENQEKPVENVGSIRKEVENMLQKGKSVEDSETRISTLKGILSFLEKKDEKVLEKDSDDIHKKEGTEISKQENVIEKTDEKDDTVYKLHVQVDSANEEENSDDIKKVVVLVHI